MISRLQLRPSASSRPGNPVLPVYLPLCLVLLLVVQTLPVTAQEPAISLDKQSIPATGQQSALLTVTAYGRYAISAASQQGVGLQLIDRMSGPGPIAGRSGERDGRLDLILDRGVYRIITHAAADGTGDVTLTAQPFTELNAARRLRLIEHKLVRSELGDLQQRSYWLLIDQRHTVVIEAAGRNLADLRLWQDGSWLVDQMPNSATVEPQVGQPLAVRRLVADLNPGLYLLTAYGGPAVPWAQDAEQHPLYVRWGIPKLAAADRRHHITSPFGVDRYLVPKAVSYFRLELPRAAPATLRVTDYHPAQAFSNSGRQAEISKESLPPVAELTLPGNASSGYYLVTVSRPAGQPYVLQYFEHKPYYKFEGSGDYWISTLHAGYSGDTVDATAMLVAQPRKGGKKRLIQSQVIAINRSHGWQRRFNLLEPLTLYVNIADTGRYRVVGQDVKAEIRFEPFLTDRPRNYQAPDFEPSGHTWTLQRGYYVLSARPRGKGKGIMTLSIQPQSQKDDRPQLQRVQTSVVFAPVHLRSDHRYTLYLNRQPGVKAGVVLRRLPIDLRQPLPLSLAAGATRAFPIDIPEAGAITVRAEDGTLADFVIDHGARVRSLQVLAGTHMMQVYNTGSDPTWYSVNFIPARQEPDTPLPPLPQQSLQRLPAFPLLLASRPYYTDVKRKQQTTLRVKVDEATLYRLESTGLLQTEGNLRTRTQPSLARQAANGVGRNFLLQPYLRAGNYQLSIVPQGNTMGHMGVRLQRTHLHQGGQLQDGIAARFTLPASDGLIYRFDIPAEGRYRLHSFALDRNVRIRLEDNDAWPLLPPGSKAEVERRFTAGRYLVTILPEAVDTRVVTLLQQIAPPIKRSGHGPHHLDLNQTVRHRWFEPQPDAAGQMPPRVPDQWRFSVPAQVTASIALQDPMQGELFRIDSAAPHTPVVRMAPKKLWQGMLQPGDYRLQVVSARRNNRLDYTLSVSTTELVAGQQRDLDAPNDVSLAIGSDSLVDISSYGKQDVRARLYDAHDQLVAQNDDRVNDWNFAITRHLRKGTYRLRVEPVGSTTAKTRVAVYVPQAIQEAAHSLPLHDTIQDPHLHTYPLRLSADKPMLVFTARSRDNIGMALDVRRSRSDEARAAWQTLASVTGINPHLTIALGKAFNDARYRFRIWSIDRRQAPIDLQAQALTPTMYAAQELFTQGVELMPVDNLPSGFGVAAVAFEQPGLIQLQPPFDRLHWAAATDQALSVDNSGRIAIAGNRLWVAGWIDHLGRRLKARPLTLQDDGEITFVTPANTVATVRRGGMQTSNRNTPTTVLILAKSRSGQPGLQIGPAPRHLMGIAKHAAIAVANESVDKRPMPVRVWNAGDTNDALPVTLQQFSFAPTATENLVWGRHDMTLDGVQARFYDLPAGYKQLRLVLPANTAAVLRHQGVLIQTFWSGDEATVQHVDSPADHLQLIHQNGGLQAASVVLFPLAQPEPPTVLTHSRLFKRHFPNSGTFYLPVHLAANDIITIRQLKLFGQDASVTWIDQSGRIQRGPTIQIRDSGTLAINHQPGLLVAWLEDQNGYPQLEYPAAETRVVQLPTHLSLTGESMTLTFEQAATTQLQLLTTTPVIADFRAGDQNRRIKILPQGADVSLYLPSGQSAITLQAANSGNLAGNLALFGSAIEPIAEGLGRKVELAPGETRIFSFTLSQPRHIGVGVLASIDRATCRLLDIRGNTLGSGVIQEHRLRPGTYLLAVMVPSDGSAMTIQPALVGSQPPASGPPQDVIRHYQELAGLKAIRGE